MSELLYPQTIPQVKFREMRVDGSWLANHTSNLSSSLINRRALLGIVILSVFFVMAILAPILAPVDPLRTDLLSRRAPPSWGQPFGSDELGRDNLSRVMYGARLSLQVGLGTVLLAVVIGGLLGVLAGFCGGWLDSLTMGLMDAMLAFPTLLLAIVIVALLGRGLSNAMLAVALAAVPTYTRLMRISILGVRDREYVLAAHSLGASQIRLLLHHILPSIWPVLLTQAMLGVGIAILEVAGLSFLGLGAEPPMPEWGAMISQGRNAIFSAPYIVLFPSLAIILAVLGFNLLGDGLRDIMDPRHLA